MRLCSYTKLRDLEDNPRLWVCTFALFINFMWIFWSFFYQFITTRLQKMSSIQVSYAEKYICKCKNIKCKSTGYGQFKSIFLNSISEALHLLKIQQMKAFLPYYSWKIIYLNWAETLFLQRLTHLFFSNLRLILKSQWSGQINYKLP